MLLKNTKIQHKDPDGRRALLPKVDKPEPPPAKVHFAKEDGYTVLVSDRPVDEAALKAAVEDFPP